MLKTSIINIIALLITIFVVLLMGVPMTQTCAVIIAFMIIRHLAHTVADHISDKKIPTVYQWAAYALELLALILGVCGLLYQNVYSLIFALIFLVVDGILMVVNNKKAKVAVANDTTAEA